MDAKYKTNYKVRMADADRFGALKLSAMFEMLQEAATEDSLRIGVDAASLKPVGLGWVISKFFIEINRLPRWNERVYITTWPSVRSRIATDREFVAQTQSGETLFSARSQWVLFDISTRRIAKLERVKQWDKIETEFANADDLDAQLEKPAPDSPSVSCDVRKNDIDINGHVNNSVYIVLATQSLPDDFRKTPASVRIKFLEEIKPEEKVKSACRIAEGATFHSIFNAQTNRECARINIAWR